MCACVCVWGGGRGGVARGFHPRGSESKMTKREKGKTCSKGLQVFYLPLVLQMEMSWNEAAVIFEFNVFTTPEKRQQKSY